MIFQLSSQSLPEPGVWRKHLFIWPLKITFFGNSHIFSTFKGRTFTFPYYVFAERIAFLNTLFSHIYIFITRNKQKISKTSLLREIKNKECHQKQMCTDILFYSADFLVENSKYVDKHFPSLKSHLVKNKFKE